MKRILGIISKNRILNNIKKNANNDLLKNIHHIEINVFNKNNPLDYSPGDSVGIYPENEDSKVNNIINIFSKQDLLIHHKKNEITHLLKKKFNIYFLSKKFLKKYSFLLSKAENSFDLEKSWDMFNLLKKYPINISQFGLEDLFKIMEPIKPRLYSISSSMKIHINEIHITVSHYPIMFNGKKTYGHCSTFLSKLKKGDKLYFFIHNNQRFRFPKSNNNIILIGTGTGIAPFRSLLYERMNQNLTGKYWLFFGFRNYHVDFLYKDEIKKWKHEKIIYKLDLSFSRDQEEKIYIQNKIWDNRKDFFIWIQEGAYIYICGRKNPMSIDVENMIIRVIECVGHFNGQSFVEQMKKEKKLIQNVY
ncbi:flavodoxin domain-containing protein [Blattabacterium cuenoti]|uniref:hypothetical protein n=1 Tax=Blattabacterium cuenoti TaxID=1653831 RepID=UPI00163D0694|nr:hypothetical protein [Blattabacterium cuenoti]